MTDLVAFLLKSSIILLAFYTGYWFLLCKTTHFKLNRYYLLSGLLLSLSIPFMHFSLPNEYPDEIFVTLDSIQVVALPAVQQAHSFDYYKLLTGVYYLGMLFLSFRLFVQLYSLIKLYFSSQKEIINEKKIALTDKNSASFSFFGLIFISNKDRNSDEFKAILRHEYVHVRQYHSVDILLAEVLLIVLWFNPFAWLYLKSIKANHEFLADEAVVNTGFSANRYVEILFEQSSGMQLSLANNFNQSLTFKRLNMMKKIRSNKITQLKVLIALPVIIAMVIFVSCSKELLDVQTEKNKEVKQFESNPAKENNASGDEEVFFIVEQMPQFPGGELGLRKYIAMNVKYPQEAREKGIEGKVYVRFTVTKTGDVANVQIARGVDSILDNEAIRVIKTLPKWQAAEQDGKKVNVYYTVPIKFKVESEDMYQNINTNSEDISVVTSTSKSVVEIDEKTFKVVEKMPEFQGDKYGFRSFLANNLTYPEEAKKNKVEGTVYVRFRVTSNGNVDKVETVRSPSVLLNDEAERVVKLSSGKWKSGEHDGKKVNVWYTVPILFKLK